MARAIDGTWNSFLLNLSYLTLRDFQENKAGLNTLKTAVESQPTLTLPNEWVSVEERLPAPTENPVLVYDCTGVNMAWYSYAMGWTYRTRLPGVEITHWMPLPEPPKEE